MKNSPIKIPDMLNEAYDYDKPVPFSRGRRLDIGNTTVLVLSGTASVDENGLSIHQNDFDKQVERTYANITRLLEVEGMTWKDVVHTRIYLRDIDRDYARLAELRFEIFKRHGIDDFPASTCVEARLCRSELLIEIETVAIRHNE